MFRSTSRTHLCDVKLRFSHLWTDACKDCQSRQAGLEAHVVWGHSSSALRDPLPRPARLAQRTTSSWRQLGSDLINLWANDSRFMLIEVKVPIKHLLLFVCFRIPFYKLISYMHRLPQTNWIFRVQSDWVLLVLIFSNLPIHLLEPRWLRGTRAAKAKSCSKCRMATTKEPTGQLPSQPHEQTCHKLHLKGR